MDFGQLFSDLLNAQLDIGLGHPILWREIVGNVFGLASALLGMNRKVMAWPIGIIGNVLLFTVFLGGVFWTPQDLDLWGQAGRQVFFAAVSVYGWIRWWQYRHRTQSDQGVQPRLATAKERVFLVVAAAVGWVVFYFVLTALGSWGPASDAWILIGSILATYGMARGWVEFWLIWIAVDAVGVPLLVLGGFYPSAIMYALYGLNALVGFLLWRRSARRQEMPPTDEVVEEDVAAPTPAQS
ncbi:nicotinamide riboside transporter PnuC [Parenemella sanctibonifatiensis]|uniref:nicotinamide riboside transporter PnuC n=1 Tax=Parenemella sanctibonifatiensis TaxID=2016505 RepID=UPI001E32C603|nr:nicotinamide riboside transporter PnuC [Parenemella sanctibonifatiensis]